MKLKVRQETVTCKNCGCENNYYYLSDFSYGEWLLELDNGKYMYIYLFNNDVWEDLNKIIDSIKTNTKMRKVEPLKYQEAFLETCDNTVMLNSNKCKGCGENDFQGTLTKSKFTEIEVISPSHDNWRALEFDKKYSIIERIIR